MLSLMLFMSTFVDCYAVDAEGFTLQEPLEQYQCDDGTYALLQKHPVNAECEMEFHFLRRCDKPVEVEYEADDPATPEPVADPIKSCENYTLEDGCP